MTEEDNSSGSQGYIGEYYIPFIIVQLERRNRRGGSFYSGCEQYRKPAQSDPSALARIASEEKWEQEFFEDLLSGKPLED